MARRWKRRTLLTGGLALAGSGAFGAPPWASPANATESGSVKIGLIMPQTGTFSQNGRDVVNGLMLALSQVGNKAAGRQIKVLVEDDQGTPAQSLSKARKLVELDKVDVLMGPLTSNSGYALRDYLDENRIPAVYPIVSADDLTQRNRTPWIVRTGWSGSQPNHPFGEYAARTLRYTRIAAIAFDFSAGWEYVGGFQDTFEQNGGRVVVRLWPPTGTPDYSPYFSRIPRDVDAVYAGFSGADALRFLQQYREFGLMGRIPLIGSGNFTDEHVLFQEGALATGIVTALHYSAALKTPANREFVRLYVRAYNRVPSYYSEGAYTGAQFILRGIDAVGGRLADRTGFVAGMRRVVLPDDPRGPVRLDAWGNPVENVYIRRVDIVNGQPQNTVIHTYPQVSQFWTFQPEEYLQRPPYTRDYPPPHP
jgi:branched-chain amino acid transport system substrate-binding protein